MDNDHRRSKLVECIVCHEVSNVRTLSEMRRHVAVRHANGTYSTITCGVCRGKYYDARHFHEHTEQSPKCSTAYHMLYQALPEHVQIAFTSLVDQMIRPVANSTCWGAGDNQQGLIHGAIATEQVKSSMPVIIAISGDNDDNDNNNKEATSTNGAEGGGGKKCFEYARTWTRSSKPPGGGGIRILKDDDDGESTDEDNGNSKRSSLLEFILEKSDVNDSSNAETENTAGGDGEQLQCCGDVDPGNNTAVSVAGAITDGEDDVGSSRSSVDGSPQKFAATTSQDEANKKRYGEKWVTSCKEILARRQSDGWILCHVCGISLQTRHYFVPLNHACLHTRRLLAQLRCSHCPFTARHPETIRHHRRSRHGISTSINLLGLLTEQGSHLMETFARCFDRDVTNGKTEERTLDGNRTKSADFLAGLPEERGFGETQAMTAGDSNLGQATSSSTATAVPNDPQPSYDGHTTKRLY